MTEVLAEAAAVAKTGAPRERWIKSVRASGRWLGAMTTDIRVRDFSLRTDEPVAVGGTNSAPTPMEVLASAVNGCITVVIETVATELGIVLGSIDTETVAHMDVRGFQGTADVSPHFTDFTLRVVVAASADADLRAELCAQVERRCPALNLVRDARVPFDLQWEFATPER